MFTLLFSIINANSDYKGTKITSKVVLMMEDCLTRRPKLKSLYVENVINKIFLHLSLKVTY